MGSDGIRISVDFVRFQICLDGCLHREQRVHGGSQSSGVGHDGATY